MAKILKLRYKVHSGTLPNGLELDPDTGKLTGSVGFDSLGTGPQWTGPNAGSLGAFDEDDEFEVTLTATGDDVLFSLVSSQDKLPWGLVLNPVTGIIGGTIAPLKLRQAEEASTFDGPKWNTQFGKLAGYEEGATSALTISATPIGERTIREYSIVQGALPWGLKLNPLTGTITGSVVDLKNPGAYVDVPKLPTPEWTTPNGSLGIHKELESITYTIAATPAPGRSMAKYVIRSGALPWGLRLNQATGKITGTLVDQHQVEEPYIDPLLVPSFKADLELKDQEGNLITTTPVANGVLPTVNANEVFRWGLGANIPEGRTFKGFYLESGTLPFGVRLTSSGEIIGSIGPEPEQKTYEFVVGVWTTGSLLDPTYKTQSYKLTVQ